MKSLWRSILVPSMPGREAQRQIVLSDIHFRWSKFSDADLSGLKDRADLVSQVAAKYGQETNVAGRDVDALLKGRIVRPVRAAPTPPRVPTPASPPHPLS